MPRLFRAASIPSDVVLRAVAIVMVAFNHSHLDAPFWNWKGGMAVLMMLMGLNLARFGLSGADPAGARRAIADLLWRTFFPAFCFSLFYLSLYRQFPWTEVLFVANFFTPWHLQLFPVWYSQMLLQMLTGMYLLFCIPPVARGILSRPVAGMLLLFAAGVLMKLFMPLVWDTRHLWQRVPHAYFWNLALGGLVYFLAFTPNRVPFARLAAVVCVVIGAAVGYGSTELEYYVLIAAGLFLVSVRQMRLPWVVSQTLVVISSATYAIFLMHVFWFKILELAYEQVFGNGEPPAVLSDAQFVFGVVVSIACWLVFTSFTRTLQSLALPRLGFARTLNPSTAES
jgi:hypothetical protein